MVKNVKSKSKSNLYLSSSQNIVRTTAKYAYKCLNEIKTGRS